MVNEKMIECGPPNGLLRRGLNLVSGWQAKDDSFRANGSRIFLWIVEQINREQVSGIIVKGGIPCVVLGGHFDGEAPLR